MIHRLYKMLTRRFAPTEVISDDRCRRETYVADGDTYDVKYFDGELKTIERRSTLLNRGAEYTVYD